MLPLFKYFVNTVILAPLVVKYGLKGPGCCWEGILQILAVASVLNVLAGTQALAKKCSVSVRLNSLPA